MIVLHCPFFGNTDFSMPFYSSTMAKNICLGAAQDTILSLYDVLIRDPGAAVWPCYYHRLITSTMVVVMNATDSPTSEKLRLVDLCHKSVEVLRHMRFSSSMKGIALVQAILDRLNATADTTTMEGDASLDTANWGISIASPSDVMVGDLAHPATIDSQLPSTAN